MHSRQPVTRYKLRLQLQDHTGNQWVTAFGDAGDAVMGMNAAKLQAKEQQGRDFIIQQRVSRTGVFKLKVMQPDGSPHHQECKVGELMGVHEAL